MYFTLFELSMDIQSKSTFVPHRHHLLFVSLLVAFLACLFAISFACLLASLFLCLSYLSCLFAWRLLSIIYAFSFHCLFVGFLVFAFTCTHMERGHTELGHTELGHNLLVTSKKSMYASMWLGRVVAFSRSRV